MNLERNLKKLFEIVDDLQREYPIKKFTLDGRLVGDIGEILVQENYDVTLFPDLRAIYDGKDSRGRPIQIKATFKESLNFPCNESDIPEYYIGIKIHSDGTFEEIYNGKGSNIWELVKNRKKTKIGSFQISLSALRAINQNVTVNDRIKKRTHSN